MIGACRDLAKKLGMYNSDACSTLIPIYRYPFLDEQVVQLVCSLATQVKCNPLLPDGTGEPQ